MKRPIVVIAIACLYLLVGVVGFVAHFHELLAHHPDAIAIEVTEMLAVVSGLGLLMRQNWARWLALAWIVFHVLISILHPLPELAIHCAFLAVIAWALLRRGSVQWFRQTTAA